MDSTMFVGIITLIVTLIIDIINRIKMIKDNEPQLSFELKNINDILFLIIRNTGNTKASDIKINIKKIRNNGSNALEEDFIFSVPFELNSGEATQGMIAICGENITQRVFPYVDIEVSYNKQHFKKQVSYERQVFFNPDEGDKTLQNIEKEIQLFNEQIDKLRKPILRMANYFDGNQVAPFEEINLITDKNFQKDLYNAVVEKKKEETTSREEAISSRLR
ncbi:MAG: hypothetical protein J6B89_03645 [Bacilli bacterium]|nr:hypothetical protein [Bacilli bacterium]